MKNEALAIPKLISSDKAKSKIKRNSVLAFVGIFGGQFFIVFGFILLIVHSFIKEGWVCNECGTILIYLSFPLMLAGGHFLDKASEKFN